MFIKQGDTVTVTRESLRTFGPTAAIILQELYREYGSDITLNFQEWCSPGGCLDFLDPTLVKSTITKLETRNKIIVEGDVIYLFGREKKQQSVAGILGIPEPEEPEKTKKNTDNFAMAHVLCEVTGQADGLHTPKRFLRLASDLLSAKYTIDDIKNRYGKDGWWYKNEFKGQKGYAPNESDIRRTIDKKAPAPTRDDFWA